MAFFFCFCFLILQLTHEVCICTNAKYSKIHLKAPGAIAPTVHSILSLKPEEHRRQASASAILSSSHRSNSCYGEVAHAALPCYKPDLLLHAPPEASAKAECEPFSPPTGSQSFFITESKALSRREAGPETPAGRAPSTGQP